MHPATRIDLRRYRGGPASHRHEHHQIVVALEGSMGMDIDGRGSRVSRDVAARVPSGAAHAFEARPDSRFLVVDIAVDDPWRAARARPFVHVSPDVRGYLDFLGARAAGGALPGAMAHPAARLLVELLGASPDALARAPRTPPAALARACELMAGRLDRPTTVADVAGPCGRSPARLHALFREHLGTTPRRWLLERRLDEAARLLLATRWPVSRVAAAVGFADASAFGRAFRRSRGVTPWAHRERAGGAVDRVRHESGQDSREP